MSGWGSSQKPNMLCLSVLIIDHGKSDTCYQRSLFNRQSRTDRTLISGEMESIVLLIENLAQL